MINGVKVKIPVLNDKGEVVDLEAPVFATVRKCPKLAGLIKKVRKAKIKYTRAEIETGRAEAAMFEADDLDTAEALVNEKSETSEKLAQAFVNSMAEFAQAGFVGAGYTKEDADSFVGILSLEQMGALFDAAQTGINVVDFTQPA